MNYCDRLSEKGLAIFLLHGVIEKSHYMVRNYTKKHLEKDYFYNFARELKQKGHPVSMDEVVQHYLEGRPYPPRAFALTFDDGFENNYSIAAPVLEDLGLPATFYLTSDFIDQNSMSWVDRIEYCLETVSEARLSLPWDARKYILQSARDKILFLDYLRFRVKQDKTINPDEMAGSIFAQCGIEEVWHNLDPLDKKMSWRQVQELHKCKLFIVGGHSHRHVNLNFLTYEELEHEVITSISLLQQKAQVRSQHYSYPEGLEYCYSDKVIEVLQNNGIICSPTAIDGINDLSTDLFHLKRIAVI